MLSTYSNDTLPLLSIKEIEVQMMGKISGDIDRHPPKAFDIFDIMCHRIESEVSTDTLLGLHFISSTCSRAVADARKGNVNSSKFWLEYVNYLDPVETENTRLIKNSLLYPAWAFHKYSEKDFAAAKDDLCTAIQEMDKFGEYNRMPIMLSSCAEQYLNLCKVLLMQEEADTAFKELGNLLFYLYTGENLLSVSFGKWTDISAMDESVRILMINYITDSALAKLIHNAADFNTHHFELLFGPLFKREIPGNEHYSAYKNLAIALNFFFKGEYDYFLKHLADNFIKLEHLPDLYHAFIIDKLINSLTLISYDKLDELSALSEIYLNKVNLKAINKGPKKGFHLKSPLRENA